jgi:hypothetical protein
VVASGVEIIDHRTIQPDDEYRVLEYIQSCDISPTTKQIVEALDMKADRIYYYLQTLELRGYVKLVIATNIQEKENFDIYYVWKLKQGDL